LLLILKKKKFTSRDLSHCRDQTSLTFYKPQMQLCSSKNQRKESGNYSLTKPETDRRFTVNKQFKDKKKTFRSKPQPKTSRKATRHINTDLSEQGNRFNNTEVYQQ